MHRRISAGSPPACAVGRWAPRCSIMTFHHRRGWCVCAPQHKPFARTLIPLLLPINSMNLLLCFWLCACVRGFSIISSRWCEYWLHLSVCGAVLCALAKSWRFFVDQRRTRAATCARDRRRVRHEVFYFGTSCKISFTCCCFFQVKRD